jgi:hypothetical protein
MDGYMRTPQKIILSLIILTLVGGGLFWYFSQRSVVKEISTTVQRSEEKKLSQLEISAPKKSKIKKKDPLFFRRFFSCYNKKAKSKRIDQRSF